MSIAIICPGRDVRAWEEAIHACDSDLKVETWPQIQHPCQVEYVLCWDHPQGVLQQFPALKCISSLGAGVNHLLEDSSCPADIPLVRLVDQGLRQSMAEYVLLGVLEQVRQFPGYRRQQSRGAWSRLPERRLDEVGVGIMGFGEIGSYVAAKMEAFGCRVYGWCRRPRDVAGVQVFSGSDQLGEFLRLADILVCMLPLTQETRGVLNAGTFARLPRNAYLINVARGAHLVDADLISALDSGQLSGALLDVFREEPLPARHPFWTHAGITITPHIASVTNPISAAPQVVDNYRRALKGEPLLHAVDRSQGY
jgi:glyoxylate/hydroxypyruvate reductase A